MKTCYHCGKTILFGGKKAGSSLFCSTTCASNRALIDASRQVPEALLQQKLQSLHQGPCPKCGGPGPVDVHTSHRVWSALAVTAWGDRPEVSCRPCGNKRRIADTVFSLLLGWWGIPWGLLRTPVQVWKNLSGLRETGDPTRPSKELEKTLRLTLAKESLGTDSRRAA